MRLLMLSGDRVTTVGEKGPFYYLQEIFSRYWDRVDVLCPDPGAPVKVTTIHGNVYFHPSTGGRLKHAQYLRSRGRELLREFKHDVLVSHDYGIYSNGRAASVLSQEFKAPWLSEIFHVPGIPRAADWRERLDPWITRAYVKRALRAGVTGFRVMNHREMPEFLRGCGVPLEKIRYISALYLDLETFAPVPHTQKKYDVTFVGRMVGNKGVGTVLEALGAWSRRHKPLRACFVGKGPLRDQLERRAGVLGIADTTTWIDWLPAKSDVAQLYRESRIVVCASYNEGGPRFTCEAMACGTPCVSTPIGVMPDLIRDGENGWFFMFDAASLLTAFERALLDSAAWERAAGACRASVLPFDAASMIERYARGVQAVARRESPTEGERP